MDGSFTIESEKFLRFHAFAHNKIRRCLTHFLETQIDLHIAESGGNSFGNSQITRDDVSFSFDVYHIENNIILENQLRIRFLTEILHFENDVRLVNYIYNTLSSLLSRYGMIYIVHNRTSTDVSKLKEMDLNLKEKTLTQDSNNNITIDDDKEKFLGMIQQH